MLHVGTRSSQRPEEKEWGLLMVNVTIYIYVYIYIAYMDPMGIGIPQVFMDATEMRYPTIQSDI